MDNVTDIEQFKKGRITPWQDQATSGWEKAGLSEDERRTALKKLNQSIAPLFPPFEYETNLTIPPDISEADRDALIESHKQSTNAALYKYISKAVFVIAGHIAVEMLNSRR